MEQREIKAGFNRRRVAGAMISVLLVGKEEPR